ncbi:FAD-dependent oxidoreductase [Cupriavidus basilensis]|uniref:FAD-dependent oxidoreductase n=1 Tax=Cupriavidus basilensis TaxID=68895 RepID=A0ABT6B4U2_9BURK|nr:GMC family oxidoreductase N-terminal domain-containing protein [Cupriavidus basilensis]MDF3839901.1 FAD-dependent oxidoreductase [Cupriavidus basilensis]
MESYDYIVVGAGSAGCVVARRLSDDPGVRVLLLEAGPPADDFWVRTPAGMAKMYQSDRYNWRYFTEPVSTLHNRRLYWPRGKGLGGTSAINGMVYTRGNRRDYDHWADLGNPGWGWDDVLSYFKRSENNERGAGPYHGSDGPLGVSDPAVKHPSAFDFLEAARRNGIPRLEDLNNGEPEGCGFFQATIHNGIRQSTYEAFLAPVRHRQNLVVQSGVQVRRVRFRGLEATGVDVVQSGELRSFSATHEVILCAGTLSSPHLLMLSGIGNGEMLQRHGIQTLMHAPGVGKNLQDHFVARVQAKTTPDSSYNRDLLGWRKYWQGICYLATHRGYLAQAASMAGAYVKSGPGIDYADLQISFRPMTFTVSPSGEAAVDNYDAISASVYRVRPASRGEILLRSADPLQPPAFIPNYLSEPEDTQAMLSGIRQLRRILATEPFASRVISEIVPGHGITSDEQLIDFMEREGHCAFHPAGTCKMGKDDMAVVDERLRVRGVDRLRVIDASIMPTVTSCNTNAPTIMIGEKGADMIRADSAAMRSSD